MTETFETLLCTHSAPVLAGLRPSGTVTCHREKLPFLEQDLAECRRLLLEHGLRCRVLCQCERHLVLMIYDPVWLEACLIGRRARKMLRQLGYPKDALVEELLEELGHRMARQGFPHEIGLFLGYPARDVEEFIRRGGLGSICTGYWKVYRHPGEARRWFARYDACREDFLARQSQGQSLRQILRAG